jgi:prophage maintenance system killer protein
VGIRYLTLEEVLYIHRNQIDLYGGSHGIRDQALLESALAQPMGSFGDIEFHLTIFDKAAAYLFYICKNHPFIDVCFSFNERSCNRNFRGRCCYDNGSCSRWFY